MNNAIYAANLRKLADYLSGLPDSAYDHHNYSPHCGTALCALGHAAFSGRFAGLYIERAPRTLANRHPSDAANEIFGAGVYDACFNTYAYGPLGRPDRSVVIQRLRQRAASLAPPAPRFDFEALAVRLAREPLALIHAEANQ